MGKKKLIKARNRTISLGRSFLNKKHEIGSALAGQTPKHPEGHCPGPQMIPTTLQLRRLPLTSLTMLAWGQRSNPEAVMVDSASPESHEKPTNFPASSLTSLPPKKPYQGNRSEAQQRYQYDSFWEGYKQAYGTSNCRKEKPIFKKEWCRQAWKMWNKEDAKSGLGMIQVTGLSNILTLNNKQVS